MFTTETKTITTTRDRVVEQATCDRCGHVMTDAYHHSGFNNFAMVRFRAGRDSKFGEDRYVEGDFCDTCLFELLARYMRIIDDSRVPDSEDFFRVYSPRRLFIEHQIASAMAEGVLTTLQEWITRYFNPAFTRRSIVDRSADTLAQDTG
ncbi:MAG: hypothetical protein EPN36_16580 [Rhodanobacteraceae bacterium]|nr:MAG: hypothetical protein EPN36_16580 [Rhodanobacteraceae bacterium]